NPIHLRGDWKQKFMLIAAAGPASNLILAVVAALAWRAVSHGDGGMLSTALLSTVLVNVTLAVFNMIPLPPLDGGNVLAGLLRGAVSDAFDRLRPYGFLILYGLLLSGILDRVMFPPARALVSFLLA